MTTNTKLQPGEIYAEAIRILPLGDIDHHGSDLYLRRTPASIALINRLENRSLLSVFRDPDGAAWYDLPFCYIPFWEEIHNRNQ